MKKIVVVMASAMLMASFAKAQEAALTTVTTTTVAQPTAVSIAPSAQPVASAAAPAMESQPTVVVEASPLSVSRAEQIRKEREKAEVETEQRIVEKLEQSRMEDEKRRQDTILGSFAGAAAAKKEEAPAAAVVAAPVVAPQAAPVPAPEVDKGASMDDVRSAVREELRASKEVVAPEEEKKKDASYIGGLVGMIDYGTADVEAVSTVGVTIGKIFEERWAVEISTSFGSSFIDDGSFLFQEVQQWSLGLGGKFYFLSGRVRPSLGAVVSYVNRDYSDLDDGYGTYTGTGLNSWAIDYGFTAGVDFAVSDRLSLGLDYRFMQNMTYKYDEDYMNTPSYRAAYGGFNLLEDREYDVWGFSLKYMF